MFHSPFAADLPTLTMLLIWLGTLGFFHLALSYGASWAGIKMTKAQCATIVGVSGLTALVPLVGPLLGVLVAIAMLRFMCKANYMQAICTILIVHFLVQLLQIGLVSYFYIYFQTH